MELMVKWTIWGADGTPSHDTRSHLVNDGGNSRTACGKRIGPDSFGDGSYPDCKICQKILDKKEVS